MPSHEAGCLRDRASAWQKCCCEIWSKSTPSTFGQCRLLTAAKSLDEITRMQTILGAQQRGAIGAQVAHSDGRGRGNAEAGQKGNDHWRRERGTDKGNGTFPRARSGGEQGGVRRRVQGAVAASAAGASASWRADGRCHWDCQRPIWVGEQRAGGCPPDALGRGEAGSCCPREAGRRRGVTRDPQG